MPECEYLSNKTCPTRKTCINSELNRMTNVDYYLREEYCKDSWPNCPTYKFIKEKEASPEPDINI